MAKKKAPQRLAGAEESCISPEQEAIIQWFRTVKFRKNLLGGVDEAAMWKKLEELYALYEAAIRAERTRYNVLLETSPSKPDGFATSPSRGGKTGAAQPEASGTGEPEDVNLAPTKVDSFAKGSPTRGAVTAKPVTERLNKGQANRLHGQFLTPRRGGACSASGPHHQWQQWPALQCKVHCPAQRPCRGCLPWY